MGVGIGRSEDSERDTIETLTNQSITGIAFRIFYDLLAHGFYHLPRSTTAINARVHVDASVASTTTPEGDP